MWFFTPTFFYESLRNIFAIQFKTSIVAVDFFNKVTCQILFIY